VPGDERYTNVPALWTKQLSQMMSDNSFTGVSYTPYPYQAYNASTVRVADGGFVRLKTVSLTWALPRNWLARTGGVKNASLSLSGNNILMLYADKRLDGQDPEFYNAGGVAQPLQRQYIISLKVGF